MNQTAPHILVDGSSYLYRAYHAMFKADLRNSAGEPTGAVRGVTAMLRRLVKDFPDSDITVIFDAKGKTFRDDIYSEYKASRAISPYFGIGIDNVKIKKIRDKNFQVCDLNL